MTQLVSAMKKETDRPHCFISVGKLASTIRDGLKPYLTGLIDMIILGLTPNRRHQVCPEALVCIRMLADGLGPSLLPFPEKLLGPMFLTGLTDNLIAALAAFVKSIPSISMMVQLKLLDLLSQILVKKPFKKPGAPQITLRDRAPMPQNIDRSPHLIILALNTLGTFNFEKWLLKEFLRDVVIIYLSSENDQIRKAAVSTCCQLISSQMIPEKSGAPVSTRGYSAEVINRVLTKLLDVGIIDPDPQIRKTVLQSLDPSFDPFLSQSDNIHSLIIALNDEEFEIRELALGTLGRLRQRNPALTLPFLRKKLSQLLSQLEMSSDKLEKEHCAILLGRLIGDSPQMVKSYTSEVQRVLFRIVSDPDPRVATYVIRALGQLAKVGQGPMWSDIDKLVNILIDAMQDQSSSTKRLEALRTLGLIAKWTGYVMDPLVNHPRLLTLMMNMIKTEQQKDIRREAMMVIGILGAIDPYRQTQLRLKAERKVKVPNPVLSLEGKKVSDPSNDGNNSAQNNASSMSLSDLLNLSPSSEEYYPTCAINALLQLLKDPSLSAHHKQAISSFNFMFKRLGLKLVSFLPQIIPAFITMLKNEAPAREFLFQELTVLVAIIKQHIRDYMDEILKVIASCWTLPLSVPILQLIDELSQALRDGFTAWLPMVMPYIVRVFQQDHSDHRYPTEHALHTLVVLNTMVDDYMYLVVPHIVRLFDAKDVSWSIRKQALVTIGKLAKHVDLSDYAALIIHPLMRAVERAASIAQSTNVQTPNNPPSSTPGLPALAEQLINAAMDALCSMTKSLDRNFIVWIPLVRKILNAHKIQNVVYNQLEYSLSTEGHVPIEEEQLSEDDIKPRIEMTPVHVENVDEQRLKRAWDTTQRSRKEDWEEWMRGFAVTLLRESPSPALRSLTGVTEYYPIVRELFNAGFLACWSVLRPQYQAQLISSLETAFLSPTMPPEILQTLLDLAEFMDHDDNPLPIDVSKLGDLALKCRAYAKALHYKEMEFKKAVKDKSGSTAVSGSLISINTLLAQPESANGILKIARQRTTDIDERWYEKLGRWEDAIRANEKLKDTDNTNPEGWLGLCHCHEALGEWDKISSLCDELLNNKSLMDRLESVKTLNSTSTGIGIGIGIYAPLQPLSFKSQIASYAAKAAWSTQSWNKMADYVSLIKNEKTIDSSFLSAALYLHNDEFELAQRFINEARDLLDTELTALVGESYQRAYNHLITVQQLAEMEEIIELKKLKPDEEGLERRKVLMGMWRERLEGCQVDVDVWQRILRVRSIIVPPLEDTRTWIKFTSICRNSGQLGLSRKTLDMLHSSASQGNPQVNMIDHPDITFTYFKQLWTEGQRSEALMKLQEFTRQAKVDNKLQARIALKLGYWQMNDDMRDLNEESIERISRCFRVATQCDPEWHRGWHAWAIINVAAVEFYSEKERDNKSDPKLISPKVRRRTVNSKLKSNEKKRMMEHLSFAVDGLMNSVSFSPGKNLQDILKLLTLLFRYPGEVYSQVLSKLEQISVDIWLQVIPQIIARVGSSVYVTNLLHPILVRLGRVHPQALVFPLSVASNTQTLKERMESAKTILSSIRQDNARLVTEAELVSKELIRVAILWPEMWHESLDEASRLYFGDHNIEGMFDKLRPLHERLEEGPQTASEDAFHQTFGKDLTKAWSWCTKYERSEKLSDLNKAWDLYYHVFRRIDKQLPTLTRLELETVSPSLLVAKNMTLAVPGTYKSKQQASSSYVCISRYDPVLKVITSKQRPRRLTIYGNDGLDHGFLLKGHEDLRQDERVMQLFGLVNTLLKKDVRTRRCDLSIERYAVVPLSSNSGLIGWVIHSDTFHHLIREYRLSRNIVLNDEYKFMQRMAPDYEKLPVLQKVEAFEYAMSRTESNDLERVLWLRSPNSETWMLRRSNFTRSIAVMSMVGYILGLGDRHPSNLMLDRHTGKVIHIDFGDCFEVAMKREKFPEKIPFRLTRMLVNAMDVSGLEGNFRTTSENVMTVLRSNGESLLAVLEAFVHDPLINWRLLDLGGSGKILNQEQNNDGNFPDSPHSPKRRMSLSGAKTRSIESEYDDDLEIQNKNEDEKAIFVKRSNSNSRGDNRDDSDTSKGKKRSKEQMIRSVFRERAFAEDENDNNSDDLIDSAESPREEINQRALLVSIHSDRMIVVFTEF
eukprot:TRINITY_DN3337_c0_g1_i2.p1 TRINITY_DN3337_c0_g1~~TRINITY_DN3337_c0_g1_i2.p1  ORF type:complete len:2473 (-),score=614.63 TRINITY_DN3337_c0_g1_i2:487-6948(-)